MWSVHFYSPHPYLNAPERNIVQNQSIISDSLLVEGQYKTWILDWTSTMDRYHGLLDSKMDSVFRLEFWLPGVKGHMHIDQQQSFAYSIIRRLQNLLPKSTQCIYTDWNITYLSIYLSIVATKVVISPAGSRAMIKARSTDDSTPVLLMILLPFEGQCHKARVPIAYTYSICSYFLHVGPISMSI